MAVQVGDIVRIESNLVAQIIEETLPKKILEAKVIEVIEDDIEGDTLEKSYYVQIKLPSIRVYEDEVTPLSRRARSQ